MIYKEVQQDLFSVPSDYALAHCISSDFALGAGIAKEFNKRFDMRRRLIDENADHIMPLPFVARCIPVSANGQVILNLVTKPFYYRKPTYGTLTQALFSMRTTAIMLGIKRIAMPKIGCGLDRLEWEQVSRIIQHVFDNTDVEIIVCYQ